MHTRNTTTMHTRIVARLTSFFTEFRDTLCLILGLCGASPRSPDAEEYPGVQEYEGDDGQDARADQPRVVDVVPAGQLGQFRRRKTCF